MLSLIICHNNIIGNFEKQWFPQLPKSSAPLVVGHIACVSLLTLTLLTLDNVNVANTSYLLLTVATLDNGDTPTLTS